jgi:antitoxin VapB
MSDVKIAKLFRNGGSQAVRLPAEFRFEGDEVYVRRDEATGDVILSSTSRASREAYWDDLFTRLDAHHVSQEDLDNFMVERPLNRPYERPPLFPDEE